MINKQETTIFNTVVSSSSSNTQSVIGNLVDVSSTSETPISALPLEMIYHIESFLDLKDKVSFTQSLIDAGFSMFLDDEKILLEFNRQFLTQKINILLANNKQIYDFSKFYALEAQEEEETTNIYSLLFNQMCKDFRERKRVSEKIAALVETLDFSCLDVDRIKFYLDKENSNKDFQALIDILFPDLTELEARKEIEYRIQVFCAKRNVVFNYLSYDAQKITEELLAFLSMEREYRGMPIDFAERTQKLASSHLIPIMQKINEKMQAMPVEELRALLIMALDGAQRDCFCEKMIELGTQDNPFYSKVSPYFYALKNDFLCRIDITEPNRILCLRNPSNYQMYVHYVTAYADDAYLRGHAAALMTSFMEIQIANGEEPVSVSHYGNVGIFSPYHMYIKDFYNRMEEEHGMSLLQLFIDEC